MKRKWLVAVFAALGLIGFALRVCAASQTLILWDGETHHTGVGWVSPTGEGMSVAVVKTSALKPRTVVFHLAHPNTFVECGWQWANWYPAFTGTDFSPYDTLEVAVQVAGARLPGDILISLASPGDHCCTGRVSLKQYAPNLLDGRWHTLRIPLADLYHADRGELRTRFSGSSFDVKHTAQIILGTWNGSGDFKVFLNDLSLKRENTRKK